MVNIDLWNAEARATRLAWCRTLDSAQRVLEDAAADEVQARLWWRGAEIVLTRPAIGAPWMTARKSRVPTNENENAPGA